MEEVTTYKISYLGYQLEMQKGYRDGDIRNAAIFGAVSYPVRLPIIITGYDPCY